MLFLQEPKKSIIQEPKELKCYKDTHQSEVVTPGLIVCRRFPWLAYSPDRVVLIDNVPIQVYINLIFNIIIN